MRSEITGLSVTTDTLNSKASHKPRRSFRQRQALMAAAGAMVFATSAFGQLFMDTNGSLAGVGSGTTTWNAAATDWNTTTGAGGAAQAWVSGDVANFNATGNPSFTVQLQDSETASGLNFNVGGTVITTAAGTTGEQLNINSGTYTPSSNTGGFVINALLAGNGRQVIAVPMVGSGDMVINSFQNNGSSTVDLAGVMSQYTGNIYVNDLVAPTSTSTTKSGVTTVTTTILSSSFNAQIQLDSPVSGGTIYLDQWSSLQTDNQIGTPTGLTESGNAEAAGAYPGTPGDYSTGTLVQATPNIYTIGDNIVLNYNNASPGSTTYNTLGAANGPTITIGGVATKFQKIVNYGGTISTPTGVTAGLVIAGSNGTTILSGANTYSGNTVAAFTDTNGFLQLGAPNTLPATGWLVLGNNFNVATTVTTNGGTPVPSAPTVAGSVGPTDLSGNSQTIAGLQTGNNGTTAIAVGNIYNLSIVNTNYPVMANGQPSGTSGIGYQTNPSANPATITITPVNAQSTVFNGDIGDTNDGTGTGATVQPFTNNAPYSDGNGGGHDFVTALTNISLVLNGPTNGGNGILTLAPIDTYATTTSSVTGLPSGNEYAGTTTINANAILVFGRGFDKQLPASFTGAVGTATLPQNYTITGNGDVTVNSGGKLASLGGTFVSGASSGAGFSIGGANGTIILNSGSSFLPGEGLISGAQGAKATTTTLSPNNVGAFSTNAIQFNAGASMTFSIASATSYDYVYLNGNLTLDDGSNSNHLINIDATTTGTITSGIYTLINAAQINGSASSFTLNTSSLPSQYSVDKFSLLVGGDGSFLQLLVSAPALQWDPLQSGVNNIANGQPVTESGGEWTDGNGSDGAPATWFFDQINQQEVQWSNSATTQVLIGDTASQPGGQITLGNNIVASGGIAFGLIKPGSNYSIINSSGNNYTLSIGSGGIAVQNAAATSTTPSAEIDVPVILDASQIWNVPAGQFLNVTGSVTENDATPSYTLTVTGGGVAELGAAGSMGTLSVTGGAIALLGNAGAIGNAAISLNNGGVQYAANASPTNPITVGTGGGAFGATTNVTLTYAPNISTTNNFEVIGTGTTTFSGSVTAANLQVGEGAAGVANFNGGIHVTGVLDITGGSTYLPGTNTVGSVTIAGGTLYDSTSTELASNVVINFPGAATGGLNVVGLSTFANPINSTGSGAGAGGNSYGVTIYFDSTTPLTVTGATGGTGDQRWYATGSGTTPQITLNESSTRTGGAQYFNGNGSPMTIVVDNTTALGTSTEAFIEPAGSPGNYVIDVETATPAVTGVLRGEVLPGNNSQGFTLTKTGPGTLSTGLGPAGSSFPGTLNINQGAVDATSSSGIGGQATTIMNINIAANAILGMDYNGTHTGGAITMAAGSKMRRDLTVYTETAGTITGANFVGETDFGAITAADVVTIAGNATMDDANIEGSGEPLTTSGTFTLNNPVVVNSGVVLTVENDDPQYDPNNPTVTGYTNDSVLAFRGPTAMVTTTTPAATSNAFDDITLKPGATIKQVGPGEVRFGRFNSQGIAIIAQGTPGSDTLLQAGLDWYMVDNNATANQINTLLVVNGSGNAGLRIEAAMSATYEDPNSPTANVAITEGTTGLFGVNTMITGTGPSIAGYSVIGNAFTIMSPNRLLGLSAPYNNGTSTITPSGTLTLAANDAGNATGLINGGPAAAPGAVVNSITQGSVALALDNTSTSGGTHIYQIDPGANGATFANFAGLTVERTNSTGAAVTAQLLGTTKVPSLSITGGAKVDITNQALVVDPTTGSAPTATIRGYLVSAYDNGNWDGVGIGSTSVASVVGASAIGTTIGYVENDLLSTPYTNFGGQTVDGNAVLVKYTYMGDLNLDGVVDSTDLAMMGDAQIGWFGGDINYDNTVNADDWSLFMLGAAAYSAHGQITSAVPEPAAVSMLAVGAGMMLRRRRRA